jgi:hypothetical protein
MKINTYARLLGLFLAVGVASASALEKVNVQASRDVSLHVRVIDSNGNSDARALIHTALGTSLTAGMTWESKAPVQVSVKASTVSRAAKDLQKASCDAIVVIGNSIPAALLKDEFVVLKANTQSGDLNQTFYLLGHASRDASLNKALGLAFDHAVKSDSLREAVAGKTGPSSGIAATGR